MGGVAAFFLLSGCSAGPVRVAPSANPAFADGEIVRMGPDEVDVLYVIDHSSSMVQFGATSCLGNPGVLAFLGEEQPAISSLRVGFISTDMGTFGRPVTSCDVADGGDDGVLLHDPSAFVVGCDAEYPRFLTWEADDPDEDFGHDFECLEAMGSGGCGWEQPLAAIESALGPQAAPGAPNAGFLRDDSLLLVVHLTNEDDCSVADPRIFDDDDSLGPLNLRCFLNPDLVRPVPDLVESLLAVRPAERIAVALIAGVPSAWSGIAEEDVGDVMTAADFDAILADPAMQERIDDSEKGGGNRLVPSCSTAGFGIAFTPRRLVEWVRDLDEAGAGGLVQSICNVDFAPIDRALSALVRSKLRGGGCLGTLLLDARGHALETAEHADCTLTETFAGVGDCGAGRVHEGTADGRTVCRVCQADDPEPCTESAWSYARDPFCGGAGRIVFEPDRAPAPDSELRLRCR